MLMASILEDAQHDQHLAELDVSFMVFSREIAWRGAASEYEASCRGEVDIRGASRGPTKLLYMGLYVISLHMSSAFMRKIRLGDVRSQKHWRIWDLP